MRPNCLYDLVNHPDNLNRDYTVTYHNIHHWAWESILPIIRDMDKFKKGDTIKVPNYPGYPVDMIRKILPDIKVEVVEVNQSPVHNSMHPDYSLYVNYMGAPASDRISEPDRLCKKLLSMIEGKDIPKNSIMINVRLHNRRWMPLDNIQKLVNALNGYTCYIFINPEAEQLSYRGRPITKEDNDRDRHFMLPIEIISSELPEIKNAIIIKNASWEERLQYAKSCCFVFNLGMGACNVFGCIANLPSVSLATCKELKAQSLMGYQKSYVINLGPDTPKFDTSWHWYDDITSVSVDEVMTAFNKIKEIRNKKRPYILVSSRNLIPWPHYQKCSGGVRAIDTLAKELISKGYDAIVVDTKINTVSIQDLIQNHDAIVVYHEAVEENYLNASSYVQWILGWWGQGGREWSPSMKSTVKFFWSDLWHTEGTQKSAKMHYKLQLDIADHNLFNTNNIGERKYNVAYMGKGGAEINGMKLENKVTINWIWPETREEVAMYMKQAKFVWMTDAISSVEDEARLCGTPVIFIPNYNYSVEDFNRLQWCKHGIAIGDTPEQIKKAIDTLPLYESARKEKYSTQQMELDRFIEVTQKL